MAVSNFLLSMVYNMGKTAIIERLFNITFYRNSGIIPFYYEIKEKKMWIGDFCQEFFLTFIYQYIAFKSRKTEYLQPEDSSDFNKAIHIRTKQWKWCTNIPNFSKYR